jgi:hypothetical protein
MLSADLVIKLSLVTILSSFYLSVPENVAIKIILLSAKARIYKSL